MGAPAGNKFSKGRPIGAPNRSTAEIKEYARSFADAAIDTLVYLMNNAKEDKTKAFCADKLLDRGIGKAVAMDDDGKILKELQIIVNR